MPTIRLTEKRVRELPMGSGFTRDEEVRGLMVSAGKTKKSWVFQDDLRRNGRKQKSVRKKLGDVGVMSLVEARTAALEMKQQMRAGVDPSSSLETGITLARALEVHLAERDLAPTTVREYRYHVDNYLGSLRTRAVADLSRADCRDLLDRLTRTAGRTTAAGVCRTVRALVNTARRVDETIGENPMAFVRIPTPPRREVEEATPRALWEATEALPPRMRDLYRAFALTAARRTSMLSVKRKEVDLERNVLTFTHMKRGGPLLFPMGPRLRDMLEARMEADGESEWLWPSETSKSGRIAEPKRSEVPSPHAWRHLARTWMVAAGVPMQESMLLVGHALPGLSARYVHADQLTEAIRPWAERYEEWLFGQLAN